MRKMIFAVLAVAIILVGLNATVFAQSAAPMTISQAEQALANARADTVASVRMTLVKAEAAFYKAQEAARIAARDEENEEDAEAELARAKVVLNKARLALAKLRATVPASSAPQVASPRSTTTDRRYPVVVQQRQAPRYYQSPPRRR